MVSTWASGRITSSTAKASFTSKMGHITRALSGKAQLQDRVAISITMGASTREASTTMKLTGSDAIMTHTKGITTRGSGSTMSQLEMENKSFPMAPTMKGNFKTELKMGKADIFQTRASTKEISRMVNSMVKALLPTSIIVSTSVNGKMVSLKAREFLPGLMEINMKASM